MAKLAQSFAKYLIHAKLQAKGIVERPDVIGAIFGQTEGLLGAELDLRELQHTGRIGRIEVDIKTNKGKSFSDIIIPSSLDASETALIAASLETIDKVGPCDAKIEIVKVEDVRSQKRRYVVERAKEILMAMMDSGMPDSQKISESIKEAVRAWEVSSYHGLSCGPDIQNSDEIIVVEGRADVINLLKNGIRNAIAIEGSKIPQPIIDLSKEKVVTAFLDGDRGGDLDLKKLLAVAEIDYVARAEKGKEVEELTKKQIYKALRERIPVNQIAEKPQLEEEFTEEYEEIDDKIMKFLASLLDDLIGTRAAYLVDKNLQILSKIPLSEISNIINDFSSVYAIVFDGKINQSIVDLAEQRGIKYLIGMGFKERIAANKVKILTLKDFR
ncbi:MAG: DNA primase DnaG [Candidatus Aenigmatarchaeota archaeon]